VEGLTFLWAVIDVTFSGTDVGIGFSTPYLWIRSVVTQSSVLGPIFFILYINSICNMTIDGKFVTYADDTCLLFLDYFWDSVLCEAIKKTKTVEG